MWAIPLSSHKRTLSSHRTPGSSFPPGQGKRLSLRLAAGVRKKKTWSEEKAFSPGSPLQGAQLWSPGAVSRRTAETCCTRQNQPSVPSATTPGGPRRAPRLSPLTASECVPCCCSCFLSFCNSVFNGADFLRLMTGERINLLFISNRFQ